ncbi:sodium:solute symporter family protein [Bryobacter aggregatus]|uniref:sodium:solute symporter family protein n=1 Tax=Bryobacter aggregatus TaxID=360054 RepID=UPI0004E14AE4|nr:sodium:solute symporter family protein [Bryobacter aggregatus]
MQLTPLDWVFVALYFVLNIAIGLYYRSRAGKSVDEFFLSGRDVPWWLAGTSMVATTFAADTPLAVTGLVFKGGIAGNWLWWNMVASGMMTVFLYARLWRRSGVMTDIEFSEIRYSGKPAAFLRGFRALYLGIPINCIVLGWVNLAMVKILSMVLGVDKTTALGLVLGLIAITALISTLSGLWGVLVTDAVQFFIKMGMVIVLAFASVKAVGGMDGLLAKLHAVDATRGVSVGGKGSVLNFVPDLDSVWMPMITFFVYVGMNWWATWYPGAEPGGGGYVAQRMFSAKDERHSLLATLWFQVAHYALRPWPWILTALCAMVLYPDLQDPETGYIKIMVDHLPPYLRGLMLAAFAAAYMSTIATQLNWGASYLVNDFYRRFLRPDAGDRELIRVSQAATVLLTILSAAVTFKMESISEAWKLLIVTGAGTGLVLLLRWYWWRINAWSEVSAMASAAVVSIAMQTVFHFDSDQPRDFAYIMLVTVGITTVVWLAATLLTAPEPMPVLERFYRTTHPSRFGWGPVADRVPDVQPDRDGWANLGCWLAGCTLIYGLLFGTGKLLLGETIIGLVYLAVGLVSGWWISHDLTRRGWASVAK